MAKRPKPSLSKEGIIKAALMLIDRDGLEAFSMRRLGAEMGVQAMSFYNHFPDKETLLDAVLDALMAEIEIPEPKGKWRDRLRLICESITRAMAAHPQACEILMTRSAKPVSSLPLMEAMHSALAESGMSQELHVCAYYDLVIFMRGFSLFEAEYRGPALGKKLPPQEQLANFPAVQAIAPKLFPINFEEQFSASLETLLNGLEGKLKQEKKAAKKAT